MSATVAVDEDQLLEDSAVLYLKRNVSRCEVRSTDAESGGGVRGPRIACCVFGSDFGHISTRSLQRNAPLVLGYHNPFTAETLLNHCIIHQHCERVLEG